MQHVHIAYADKDANLRIVRLFSVCLGLIGFFYVSAEFKLFIERPAFDFVNLLLTSLRVLLGISALVLIFYPAWLARPVEYQIDLMGRLFSDRFDNSPAKEKIVSIVVVTMVSLLLELVMIRWMASLFPVFSFFKNFTLLACFLGLGAGYAVAEKQPCAPALVLPMLALFVCLITLLRYDSGGGHLFTALPMQEQTSVNVWVENFGWMTLVRSSAPLYLLLATCFLICACICYPVGQLCGKLLLSTDALKAYGLNLVGSILGVAALIFMSLFWLPPVIWFTAVGGVLLFFVLLRDSHRAVGVASLCLLLAALSWPVDPATHRIYSPYQMIEHTAKSDGLMELLAGGYYYQKVYDLAERNRSHESAEDRYVRAYYEFPFNFERNPQRVAIIGAGSGNDVAAALRMGAAHVDAVEIDPAIAYLGKAYHPEHPYDDPRVTLIINDARNFFRTASGQYDLIIYGVLDSHTALSHASNLRVDSYVYTREGITQAFRLLKPDGVMSISFTLPNESLGYKLSHILQDMPDAGRPLAVRAEHDSQTITAFITQKGRAVAMPDATAFAAIGFTDVSEHFAQAYPSANIPTDDWPFFYMIKRTYPVTYLISLGMVLVLSYFFLRKTVGFTDPIERAYLPFFFLGSGFMLVETKAITELGLQLGGTWFVIAATIILVLVMAFLANLAVQRRIFQRTDIAYLGLFLSLAVGYVYALNHEQVAFALRSPMVSLIVAGALLTMPLFFSGIVFSTLISKFEVNISTALAHNLMGALFGGLMEYNSMYFGFAFLYLLAIGFYFLAWVFGRDAAAISVRAWS